METALRSVDAESVTHDVVEDDRRQAHGMEPGAQNATVAVAELLGASAISRWADAAEHYTVQVAAGQAIHGIDRDFALRELEAILHAGVETAHRGRPLHESLAESHRA